MTEANLPDHNAAQTSERRVIARREAAHLRQELGREFIRLFDPYMREKHQSNPAFGWEEADWQRQRALCEFQLSGQGVPTWLRPLMLALSSDGAIVKYREERDLEGVPYIAPPEPVFVAMIGSYTKPQRSIVFEKWGTGLPGLAPEYEPAEEYLERLRYRDVEEHRFPSLLETLRQADTSGLNGAKARLGQRSNFLPT